MLTIDHCAPNLLATGDSQGQIMIWNTKYTLCCLALKQKLPDLCYLHSLMKVVSSFAAVKSANSAGHARTAREKLMLANTSAVDQVLWLASRQRAAANRRKRVGFLVSAAHAGWIHFWNVYRGELLCKFRGTKNKTGDQVGEDGHWVTLAVLIT